MKLTTSLFLVDRDSKVPSTSRIFLLLQASSQKIAYVIKDMTLHNAYRLVFSCCFFFITAGSVSAQVLVKNELFTIPRSYMQGSNTYSFALAVDENEIIAFSSCSRPWIYFFSNKGVLVDSLKMPFDGCIRMMEFDEYDNLLFLDNMETTMCRYYRNQKRTEIIKYTKPEDWYNQLNHFYRNFEIPSIPTNYYNKSYTQDFYESRFDYNYNLYLNFKNGFIYQGFYNIIKKITNHKTYLGAKKEDIWVSDMVSIRSKLLLIDDENKTVVYYDRFYNLVFEDFKNNRVIPTTCVQVNSEPARFDYAVNKKQNRIFGISSFDKNGVSISTWEMNH